MKTRIGLISNSSSCSFTILKKDLSEYQIDKIKDYRTEGLKYGLNVFPGAEGWSIRDLEYVLEVDTMMDGFNMLDYMEKYLGIDLDKTVVDFKHDNC